MTGEIWDDVIEFFKKNADNELDEIQLQITLMCLVIK